MSIYFNSCKNYQRYGITLSKLLSLKLRCQLSTGKKDVVKIGCASGFWGDSPSASAQLIRNAEVDYIIYDYLSEITMSLLVAAQAKKPEFGFAPDFVSHAIGPHLKTIKDKGIKIISNAGGINPNGCANALKQMCQKSGVDLKVGIVTGDNLMPCKEKYIGITDMKNSQSGLPKSVHSMNAYLGSSGIVKCLEKGADIVVTGRCADSSLALGPLIHELGWKWSDYDLLASGSLAGHLIECGAQVTGGIFTDWQSVDGWHNIGYPIAEVSKSGEIFIKKPPKTGGKVTFGTVAEQMLYEIGDPRAYLLPDVVCDFSQVKIQEVGEDVVQVSGAVGNPPTNSYKVCATYLDGFKATIVCSIGGPYSVQKGHKVADAILKRCRNIFKALGLKDFLRTHVQVLGSEDTYGPHALPCDTQDKITSKNWTEKVNVGPKSPRDAALWLSVHHSDKKALDIFSMEVACAGTSMAPGLTGIVGGRPKPTPLLRLHSFLVDKKDISEKFKVEEIEEDVDIVSTNTESYDNSNKSETKEENEKNSDNLLSGNNSYLLSALAYTRSGDKGNSCNIAIIARKPEFYPYIKIKLTEDSVAHFFKHLYPDFDDNREWVKRYEVPGIHALNFVLENSLGGGGVASLRSDPQGKAFGQMILDFELNNMPDMKTI